LQLVKFVATSTCFMTSFPSCSIGALAFKHVHVKHLYYIGPAGFEPTTS
jgi:hypothetical protein